MTWLTTLAQIEKEKFSRFNLSSDRFDKLYFHTWTDLHPELNKLKELFFTLSHGQVTIERGFNVNKFIEHVNMEENSYLSWKIIMKNGFIKCFKAARKRHDIYLEERRSERKGQISKQE